MNLIELLLRYAVAGVIGWGILFVAAIVYMLVSVPWYDLVTGKFNSYLDSLEYMPDLSLFSIATKVLWPWGILRCTRQMVDVIRDYQKS